MDRMAGKNDKLDALWAEYREACPDPEPSAGFMPNLWQRIEARRTSTTFVFRRVAQVCVMATLAVTVLLAMVVIPRLQSAPVYSATYVDVLTADHPNTYVDILTGDIK
jgi:hypothetical protein